MADRLTLRASRNEIKRTIKIKSKINMQTNIQNNFMRSNRTL